MKTTLPTSGLLDLPRDWNLQIGYPVKDDPSFTTVDLPHGWRVQSIPGQAHRSELVNASGQGVAIVFIDKAEKRASIYVKKSFDGAAVVMGHRSVVSKWSGKPWKEVESSAAEGTDGLKLTSEWDLREWDGNTPREDIYYVYHVPKDHAVLRKIHSGTFGHIAGLFAQNY